MSSLFTLARRQTMPTLAGRANRGTPLPKSFAEPLLPLPLAQEHGVAASDIKKLLEAGIHTVEGLAHASKKSLKDIKGLSEMKVEKLKAAGARPPLPSPSGPRSNLGTPFQD